MSSKLLPEHDSMIAYRYSVCTGVAAAAPTGPIARTCHAQLLVIICMASSSQGLSGGLQLKADSRKCPDVPGLSTKAPALLPRVTLRPSSCQGDSQREKPAAMSGAA